jgi:hypothetical protein
MEWLQIRVFRAGERPILAQHFLHPWFIALIDGHEEVPCAGAPRRFVEICRALGDEDVPL